MKHVNLASMPGPGNIGWGAYDRSRDPEAPDPEDEKTEVHSHILEVAERYADEWFELVNALQDAGGDPRDLESEDERTRLCAVAAAVPYDSDWYNNAKAALEQLEEY